MGLTLVLHVIGVVVLIVWPGLWPWVIGVLIGNHLLLSAAVLFPRAGWLGPNLTRLPEATRLRNEIALQEDHQTGTHERRQPCTEGASSGFVGEMFFVGHGFCLSFPRRRESN